MPNYKIKYAVLEIIFILLQNEYSRDSIINARSCGTVISPYSHSLVPLAYIKQTDNMRDRCVWKTPIIRR